MCYLPPSTKCTRPLEVQVPSMAGIKIPTLMLYRTKIYPSNSLKNTPPEAADLQSSPRRTDIKVIPPQLTTIIPPHPFPSVRNDVSPSLNLLENLFRPPSRPQLETFTPPPPPITEHNESSPLTTREPLPFSSPLVPLPVLATSSLPDTALTSIEPPTLYTMPASPPSPVLHDEDLHDLMDETADLEEEINPEDAWNLVAYHIPWGSFYHGYKAGTLPGPDGKCIFLRSPTPLKNQRTGQACEKCRERKAKCSGTRPSCARCVARGHICEYSQEIKRTRSSDAVGEETALRACSPSSTSQSQCDSQRRSTPQKVQVLTGRPRSSTETTRNKCSSKQTGGPLIRRRNTDVPPPSTVSPVVKKRRLSVLEKQELEQPSQPLGAPLFSLGLFSSSPGNPGREADEPVFTHDTASTSSDPSEPESHYSLNSAAQPITFAPSEDMYLAADSVPEVSNFRFSDGSGGLVYSHSDPAITELHTGVEYDAHLHNPLPFIHPDKRPYSLVSQQFTAPSISYQHYPLSDAEQSTMFDTDGYPAYPSPKGGDGGELDLGLTTLPVSTASNIDRWREDASNMTISEIALNGVATGQSAYSSGSPRSTYLPDQHALDSTTIAYINSLELQNVASGYGLEHAYSLDWRTAN